MAKYSSRENVMALSDYIDPDREPWDALAREIMQLGEKAEICEGCFELIPTQVFAGPAYQRLCMECLIDSFIEGEPIEGDYEVMEVQ